MKLSSVLAVAVAALGIVACAGAQDDDVEVTGNDGEAKPSICYNCYNFGGSTSGFYDPPAPTFVCGTDKCSATDPNDTYLICNPANPSECKCNRCGSPGNGWPYATYNGCPSGYRYGCTSTGYCSCYL